MLIHSCKSTVDKTDPMERFIDVLRYFLAGWYLRPKGVKKPYNPILGEFFRCACTSHQGLECVYLCEQVSHHPPASAYFFSCPKKDIWVQGEVWPKSSFLGNSVAMRMHGVTRLYFANKRPGEEYLITLPSMYAHGILFGSMYLELGDTVTIKCAKTGIVAEIQFLKKGIFSGNLNEIRGKIRVGSSKLTRYSVCGNWTEKCYLIPHTDEGLKTHTKILLFDTSELIPLNKIVADLKVQEEFESRILWSNVTRSLTSGDLDAATAFKEKIEENQRTLVKSRQSKKIPWTSRYFKNMEGVWVFDLSGIPSNIDDVLPALKRKIYSKPALDIHKHFWIKPQTDTSSQAADSHSTSGSSLDSFKSTSEHLV